AHARAGKVDVSGRKRCDHAHDSSVGPGAAGRMPRRSHAAGPLESVDHAGSPEPAWDRGRHDHRITHRRRCVPRLCRARAVSQTQARRGGGGVVDKWGSHKFRGVRQRTEAWGAEVLYLPPYSPDLNPIKKAWFKLKHFLRAAKARTAEALDQAVPEALKTITADNAAAWFRHCGYALQN